MQTYPFLDGPDESLNRECVAVLRANLRLRSQGVEKATPLPPDRLLPSKAVLSRLDDLFRGTTLTAQERSELVIDFAWKVQFVPEASRKILAVGHHTGYELLFLRAAAPAAEIFAIDWLERSDPKIVALVEAKTFAGNFLSELQRFKGQFDLVFSNHVLEHMYDPDRAICVLFESLAHQGVFLCGIPLDGSHGDVYEEFWNQYASNTAKLRRVDMGHIDVGHPWKTSVSDIITTLETAGLTGAQVYCRPNHLTRGKPEFARDELMRYRRRGIRLNWLVFGPLRTLLHALFADFCPPILLKGLFALERRVWFGSNRFKNAQSYEVVAVAHKD